MGEKERIWVLLLLLLAGVAACAAPQDSLEAQLAALIAEHDLTPLPAPPAAAPAQVALGEALFYDPILSGERDVACATCHHPTLGTGDRLPLSIGAGGRGLGPARVIGPHRPFVARNAPDLFNRGLPQWRTMFWDNRVMVGADGRFLSPAGDALPPGLDNVLAVQAMFPVTAVAEMRGVSGAEMSHLAETDHEAVWAALLARLLAVPAYRELFAAAYPHTPPESLTFAHAANALAAYQSAAFSFSGAPWDRYLGGETAALSEAARRGALLFYGDGGCARCHGGPLFTDQSVHNLAVPQIGPGKGEAAPLDLGRGTVTGGQVGRYAFRTPPLRNVTLTGPYMHDGAYATLRAAVVHHLDPEAALRSYDAAAHLPPLLQDSFQAGEERWARQLSTLDPGIRPLRPLTPAEVDDLLAFLAALTDPAAADLDHLVPAAVPSGLPVP
jgi:cytochrome c peroxidase